MNFRILFLFLGLISSSIFAQTATINGLVANQTSLKALSNVRVELGKTGLYQLTDATGQFVFSGIEVGEYKLLFVYDGFEIFTQLVSAKANVTTNIAVSLQEKVLDIPEVVITHVSLTGGEQGLKDLPGSAYYISPKELQKFNYTDINRILKSIPGVNLQEEDGFGLRPNIGLRGAGVERSTKITIMEDGVLTAPAPYSASAAYYFPTVGRMQAVEILKGSAQIKYGPYTTGGAINLISTQLPTQFTARVSALGSSFFGKNLHAYVGNNHGQVAYSVEAFHYGSDGFKHLDNNASTGFNKSDYLAKLRFSSKKTAKVQQSLTLKAGMNNEVSNDTYLGLSLSDFLENPFHRYAASQKDLMTTKQTQLSALHVVQAKKWLTVTSTIYRNDFSRNWYKLDAVKDSAGVKKGIADVLENPSLYASHMAIVRGETSSNADALFVKGNNRSYYGQGVQTVVGLDLKSAEIIHDIDLGIRFHQDGMDRFQNEDKYQMSNGTMMQTVAGELGRESNRIASAQALATYIQYKGTYKKILLTAGLRNELIQMQEKDYGKNDPNRLGSDLVVSKNNVAVLIPGIAVDYKLSDEWAIFAGVHKGFSPPSAKATSKPEASVNYEGGLKLFRSALKLQVVAFYNAYSNLLGSDLAASGGAGTGDLFNGGKSMAQGIEWFSSFDIAKKLNKKYALPLTVSYTFSDARFLSDFVSTFEDWGTVRKGDQLPYLAQHQLNVGLSYEYNKWMVNAGMKFTSNMRAVAGTGKASGIDLIPQITVFDASATYQVAKNVSFFASVTNLTNQTYIVAARPAGVRPGMPRTIQLGLRAKVF
jgi:Fe(3+) dicitrate transport protein